jgi:hypothetical protein
MLYKTVNPYKIQKNYFMRKNFFSLSLGIISAREVIVTAKFGSI